MDYKKRLEELERAEKEAWANLNFIMGRKEELLSIINEPKESFEDFQGELTRTGELSGIED